MKNPVPREKTAEEIAKEFKRARQEAIGLMARYVREAVDPDNGRPGVTFVNSDPVLRVSSALYVGEYGQHWGHCICNPADKFIPVIGEYIAIKRARKHRIPESMKAFI